MHAELILEHGGAAGIRLGGHDLIESALARPWHRYRYEDTNLYELATAYLSDLPRITDTSTETSALPSLPRFRSWT